MVVGLGAKPAIQNEREWLVGNGIPKRTTSKNGRKETRRDEKEESTFYE